ncbi:unnamed protein product, partial [Amoebophrya sp. A25]
GFLTVYEDKFHPRGRVGSLLFGSRGRKKDTKGGDPLKPLPSPYSPTNGLEQVFALALTPQLFDVAQELCKKSIGENGKGIKAKAAAKFGEPCERIKTSTVGYLFEEMKKKQGTGAVVFLPSGAAGSRSFFVSVIKGVKDAEDAEKQAEKPTVKGSDTSESGAPSVVDNTDEELFSQREMGKESYHLVTQEGGAPDANGSCYDHLA